MKKYLYLLALTITISLAPNHTYASKPVNEIDPNNPIRVLQTNPELGIALQKLQEDIGYKFKDVKLLELSLRRDDKDIGHSESGCGYERLEFVGDRVLEVIVREHLWRQYPNLPAVRREIYRQQLIENQTIGYLNKALGLATLSHRQGLCSAEFESLDEHSKGDFIESLFGAIYYDDDINACKQFFARHFCEKSVAPEIRELFEILSREYQDLQRRPQPHLSPMALYAAQKPNMAFIGEAVLKMALSDFIYARYPNKIIALNRDERVNDVMTIVFTNLFKTENLNQVIKVIDPKWEKDDLTACLGHIYTTQGYKPAYNYVVWLYMDSRIPADIKALLHKNVSDPEGTVYCVSPTTQMGVSHRTILEQVLQILKREIVFGSPENTSRVDHQPLFKASLKCDGLFEVTANASRKRDAEALACAMALKQMTDRVLAETKSPSIYTYNHDRLMVAQILLERQLFDQGYADFNYFPLGELDNGNFTFYRYELQGSGIEPTIGEGISPEEAKVNAIATFVNSRPSLQDMNQDIRAGVTIHPVTLLLTINQISDLSLVWTETKQGLDHSPLFCCNIDNTFMHVTSSGSSKSDAKKKAATLALEEIGNHYEALSLNNGLCSEGPQILKLLKTWQGKQNAKLQDGLQLSSISARTTLARRQVSLLEHCILLQGKHCVWYPQSKSTLDGTRRLSLVLVVGGRDFVGQGIHVNLAKLDALRAYLSLQYPDNPLLNGLQALLQMPRIPMAPRIAPAPAPRQALAPRQAPAPAPRQAPAPAQAPKKALKVAEKAKQPAGKGINKVIPKPTAKQDQKKPRK